MNHPFAVATLFLVLFAICILLFRKLLRRMPLEPFDNEWLESYSVARYRPMERLLSQEDYNFLSAQPGYSPAIARRLRAERRRVFRAYLRVLVDDFNRLHRFAKAALVSSAQDRPDLALALLRQRVIFYYAVANLHVRLSLPGLGAARAQVAGLLQSLEMLRVQTLEWQQAASAA